MSVSVKSGAALPCQKLKAGIQPLAELITFLRLGFDGVPTFVLAGSGFLGSIGF